MKKKLAFFLAALLALPSGAPAHAVSADDSAPAPVRIQAADALLAAQEQTRQSGGFGQVDVTIAPVLILKGSVTFDVYLTGAGKTFHDSILLEANSANAAAPSARTSFCNLAAGVYSLTVAADGFVPYTQEITVGEQGYAVNLATGFYGGVNYSAGAVHPGVLTAGDVNGDGFIDDADKALLVDAVADKNTAGAADLNRDGTVNLVDLEYFLKSGKETGDTTAAIEVFVPSAAIVPGPGSNTRSEGSLTDLVEQKSSVILTPQFGGEISQDNPVSVEFDFYGNTEATMMDGIIIETGSENPVDQAVITIDYIDEAGISGTEQIPVETGISYLLQNSDVRAERDGAGSIMLYLGSQVAVKKVTLTITGMRNNNNLAEISRVEFVNGMENRIPAPQMDIPENLAASAGSGLIRLTWDACANVTGYEVQVTQDGISETMLVTGNSADLTSFGGRGLKNYTEYRIRVQSVNGTWRSGYCTEIAVTPKPDKKPDKPDNVSASGNYQSIQVSWKQMADTLTYNLYYKERSAVSYQVITGLTQTSYTLTGLKDLTEYTVYVTGVNEFGESAPSITASATTTNLEAPAIPRYHMINRGSAGEKGAHILNATHRSTGSMADSPLDAASAATAWGTTDSTPASYYETADWDDGGFNALDGDKGLTYEFDQAYRMDTIAFYCLPGYEFFYAKVRCQDADGNSFTPSVSVQNRQDNNGRPYLVLKFSQPEMVKKIQIGFGRSWVNGTIRISEVYFYHYDVLMDEIMSLYEDDLHMVLKKDVTMQTIQELRAKIHEIDEVSGEYNPDLEALERELGTAEDILNNAALKAPVEIHSGITMNEAGRGFGGLNAWQPLGITAAAGDKITIYVGHSGKKTGDAADLRLVATQYHSESNSVSSNVVSLKVGANIVDIPKIGSQSGQEAGGALYIEYTGESDAERCAVRVDGGVSVPVLDLYRVTEETERLARAAAYVEELEAYVNAMQDNHERFHTASEHASVSQYAYDEQNCILGASDILLDTMLLSLPASRLLEGLGDGTVQERAEKLLASMDAMEDMMYLFYQHKGLNADAPDEVNRIPKSHLNIRYQRMFSGAFMYAGGNHIGIEYGSAGGMVTAVPVVSDSGGKYISGRYFGWGIAHEIGHCINQDTYAAAEITNNYFSLLAQAQDTNDSVRFEYRNVYDKVTSGTKGKASNVFTQLAMYWQLHLAYDNGYNFKTYADYGDQLANLFFARVDTYSRNPSAAPKAATNGTDLTLSGDTDQNLMRLACAAAEKNLLEFFERWGMTPDAGTAAYASQFEKETRAIFYVNDEARVYRLSGGMSTLNTQGTAEAVADDAAAAVDAAASRQVNFVLGSKNIPEEDILGYEITRCTISGGRQERELAGFITAEELAAGSRFSDTLQTLNNRTVTYEITLIDKYLNRSAAKVLEPVKIEDDGSLDKTFWTVGTAGLAPAGGTDPAASDDEYPCAPKPENPAERMIDHDIDTVYEASADSGDAEITLYFNRTRNVTGFQYRFQNSITGSYEIQLLNNGKWVSATEEKAFGSELLAFVPFANDDGKYVSTYSADGIKFILHIPSGTQVSIAELDVFGITGDNADFTRLDGGAVIGKLAADFQYGKEAEDVIPADSIVFAGNYKGNPAYNVVILYDQDGNIVGGVNTNGEITAQQIIMADVPAEGDIRNVSEGTWLYWIEPEQQAAAGLDAIQRVRVELYRVNNALTNEGQRLVSDSLFVAMPQSEEMPEIQLTAQ